MLFTAETDKPVVFVAGTALGLISSGWGEIIMERYSEWHPHNMLRDTLRDTWTAGGRQVVRVLLC